MKTTGRNWPRKLDKHLRQLTNLRAVGSWEVKRTDDTHNYQPVWEDLLNDTDNTVALTPVLIRGKKCWAQIRFEIAPPPLWLPELGETYIAWNFPRVTLWTKEYKPSVQEIVAAYEDGGSAPPDYYFIGSRKDMNQLETL